MGSNNCSGDYAYNNDDSSLSYVGQGTGLVQRYHVPGCNNIRNPVEECFYCSGTYMRAPSLSPPAPYPQSLPIIRERSPTPGSRTYAQAAALGTPQASAAAVAAVRQLRPHPAQQPHPQTAAQRPVAPALPAQRLNAIQAGQRRSYAQAVRPTQNVQPARPQARNLQSRPGLGQQYPTTPTLQQARGPTQDYGLPQGQLPQGQLPHGQLAQGQGSYGQLAQGQSSYGQLPYGQFPYGHASQYGGYAGGQTFAGPAAYPAGPPMPAQNLLQIQMGNLNDLLRPEYRPEYTNNPRDVNNLVDGTRFGSHRNPMSSHSSGNSTPLTPASPGAMSIRSGTSSQSRRRTGQALRNPNLPYSCSRCPVTFSKPEALRRHFQRTHIDVEERPHACTVPSCNWRFINPKDVRRHVRSHHPEVVGDHERFYCEYPGCSKNYSRYDNCQRHMTRDHGSDSGFGASPTMSRTTSQSSHYIQPQPPPYRI